MIRRPPRSTQSRSSAASDVYKRQAIAYSTPNLALNSRHMVYAYVPNIVSIGYSVALCSRKTPTFAIFWTSAFSGVASWQQSEKVEHGSTTTNLSLSIGIKIVSVLQKPSGAQTLTFKSVTNRQTDKQKTQRLWPPWWGYPSPAKHGMLIGDFEHVLAPLKLSGSDTLFRR